MDSFAKNGPKYLRPNCRECEKQRQKEKREANIERYRERDRAYYLVTKEVQNAKSRAYYAENREKQKAYQKQYMYGLTPEEYDALMAKGCFICGSMEKLHVDHDHSCCPGGLRTCGKCVRGVLCHKHNTALGKFGDSVEELQAAITYLQSFQAS